MKRRGGVSEIHCIIMGAGEGTRMWPISTMVNKHLLKLGGKPVIRIIAEKLTFYDPGPIMSDITIVCLKKDEKDYKWEFRDWLFPSKIRFHVIEENAGTADECHDALCSLDLDGNFLLHYGDSITDLDYRTLIQFWNRAKSKALIPITQNIKHDYSEVIMDPATRKVIKMIEKPNLTTPSWTGIGIFNTRYFIEKYDEFTLYRNRGYTVDFGYHLLPAMAKDGELYAYQYDGTWYDVGNLRSYQKLYKEFQDKDLNL